MTAEDFKQLIEAPVNTEIDEVFKTHLLFVIRRTTRIALQYHDMAQEYLDSIPKVVNENIQPTS